MKVYKLVTHSPLNNFNYFIEISPNKVIVVDPLIPAQIADWLEQNSKTLVCVVLTHFHPDHVAGALEVKNQFGVKCLAGEHFLGDEKLVDEFIKDNEILTYQNGKIQFLYTPGHTNDHICLLIFDKADKMKSIITMDTLFNAGVGHCRLGGDVKVFYKTIVALNKLLEDDVVLYPGHAYMENNLRFTLKNDPENSEAKQWLTKLDSDTTMLDERKINLFLRVSSEEEFIKLRSLRDNW